MNRKEEYRAYLRSPEWKEIRGKVMHRADGRCELCGEQATQVHHVRYPKRFPDGDVKELLALCDSCHIRSHGMSAKRMELARYDFVGEKATYWLNATHDETGMEYILAEDFWRAIEGEAMAMLRAGGKAGMAIVDARASIDAEVDQAGDSEWFDVPDPGRPSFRRTLRFVNKYGAERMAAVHPHSAVGRRLRDFLIRLHKEYDANGAAKTSIATSPGVFMEGLGSEIANGVIRGLIPAFEAVGLKIKQIEDAQATSRPPDQFVTVRQACLEKSIDFTAVVSGKQTADLYIGNWLRRAGVDAGEQKAIRVGDSSLMVPVNTYRRRDIYSAIDRLMAESQVA